MTVYSEGKIIWTNQQQRGKYFKFRCWLAFQRWYQILLIPYHIAAGYYYGYSTKDIFNFCLKILQTKKQKESLK